MLKSVIQPQLAAQRLFKPELRSTYFIERTFCRVSHSGDGDDLDPTDTNRQLLGQNSSTCQMDDNVGRGKQQVASGLDGTLFILFGGFIGAMIMYYHQNNQWAKDNELKEV